MSVPSVADRGCLAAMLALAGPAQNPADGERPAALAAAERFQDRHGLRLSDLAAPPPIASPGPPAVRPEPESRRSLDWRTCPTECQQSSQVIRWETNFLRSILRRWFATVRQCYVLRRLAVRLNLREEGERPS